MTQPAIDADFVDTTPAPLAVVPTPPPSLFAAASPREQVALATEIATVLADIIEKRKLYTEIQGKKHVRVEGWQTCGMLVGVSSKIVGDVERLTNPDGYRARAVVVRVSNGIEIGAGEGICTRDERRWKTAEDYAVASMAQTRALSRSLRGVLGWIITLAGYNATPAEEVPPQGFKNDAPPAQPAGFSQTDLVKLGERKGYPGKSFGTWLVENIAADLRTREHKVLRPDEIAVAKDLLDAMPDAEDPEPEPAPPQQQRAPRQPSEAQKKMLFALHSQRGDNDGDRHLIYKRLTGKTSFKDLSADDVRKVIDYIDPQKAQGEP